MAGSDVMGACVGPEVSLAKKGVKRDFERVKKNLFRQVPFAKRIVKSTCSRIHVLIET
jgi:hypothetical protein